MTIICINASFSTGCQIPVKSELSTVLQIILKLMIKVYHQKLSSMCYIHHLNFIFTSILPVGLLSQMFKSLERTYLWYSDHTGWSSQGKKKQTHKLFGQIDFHNQFTGGWHQPDARKGAGGKKKGVTLAIPGLQQSWLGSNQQILWITLHCCFSKQTYCRVKRNKPLKPWN